MAKVRCPDFLAADNTVQFINDYSIPQSDLIFENGARSKLVTPFCGVESNSGPFNIFRSNSQTTAREYSLNTFRWVMPDHNVKLYHHHDTIHHNTIRSVNIFLQSVSKLFLCSKHDNNTSYRIIKTRILSLYNYT